MTCALLFSTESFIFHSCFESNIYKTLILYDILRACETWSLTAGEGHYLRIITMNNLFRPEWGDVMKDWKSLHNRQLLNSYSSPNIIRMLIVIRVIRVVSKLTLCFKLFGGTHCLHLHGKKIRQAGIWCMIYWEGWHGWGYVRAKGNSWPLKGRNSKHFPFYHIM